MSNVDYFKELPFYNVSIDKPKMKPLKNVDLLAELPFYKRLSIIETDHAFSGYAVSYKVEIVDKKDLIVQLEASKSSTKDLFNDLLNETRGFKYQITVKVLLKKYKPNGEIELKIDSDFASNLNYGVIEFPVQEKDFSNIEVQNNICVNVFGYENKLVFPVYISDHTFKSSIDLLLLINDDQSHYVYIKDFNTFMFHKTKNKNKKWFCKSCLQCFSSENVLIKHKEDCLSISGQQSINLEIKQLPVPFKIFADCECNFNNVECFEGTYTHKKNHEHVPCSYACNAVCIDDRLSKSIVVYRGINAAYEFIRSILKEHKYCRKNNERSIQ